MESTTLAAQTQPEIPTTAEAAPITPVEPIAGLDPAKLQELATKIKEAKATLHDSIDAEFAAFKKFQDANAAYSEALATFKAASVVESVHAEHSRAVEKVAKDATAVEAAEDELAKYIENTK